MGNSDFNDMSESLLKLQYKDRILQEYFFVMLYKDLVERAGYADSCDAGLEMDVGLRMISGGSFPALYGHLVKACCW